MENYFKYLIITFIVISCSKDNKTDKFLLEKDKKALIENIKSDKVISYKFGKILIRSSAEKDTTSKEYMAFKSDLDKIFDIISDSAKTENLTIIDYIAIYSDYKKMEKFIRKTDEDMFPTLTEALNGIYGDSTSTDTPRLKGDEKNKVEACEHAALSAVVLLSKDMGKDVALYECSETVPESLPDSELKTLIQLFRGFLFFENGLYYLSEDEITRNIGWLENNKDIDLPLTNTIFNWGNIDKAKTNIGLHSVNHLFRGIDRLMMERKIDEKRALKDFEIFLSDASKIGMDNELVWSVETFLYLKNEENDKAITSLNKLKTSRFVTDKEKKSIDESIEYLKNREPGKVLNGFYDKYFIGKIASRYIFDILSKTDWKRLLKDQDVSHSDKVFKMLETISNISRNIEKQRNSITDKGKEIIDLGKNLLK